MFDIDNLENFCSIEVHIDSIKFITNNVEVIKLDSNGDIFIKDKLVDNDTEVVDELREFLNRAKSFNT